MKTIPTVGFVALSLLLSCSTLGQGSFLFQNYYAPSGVDAPVFDAQGVPLAGTNYLAELYGGSAVNSLAPAMPRTAVPFLTGIGAGYFQAPYYVLIPGVPGATYVWLRVRAWDARLGATYEDVMTRGQGGYGESALFYALGGNPNAVPPVGLGALVGLQSFSLLPVVPEPPHGRCWPWAQRVSGVRRSGSGEDGREFIQRKVRTEAEQQCGGRPHLSGIPRQSGGRQSNTKKAGNLHVVYSDRNENPNDKADVFFVALESLNFKTWCKQSQVSLRLQKREIGLRRSLASYSLPAVLMKTNSIVGQAALILLLAEGAGAQAMFEVSNFRSPTRTPSEFSRLQCPHQLGENQPPVRGLRASGYEHQ